MISRFPQACAYFCNVAKDGEYFVPRNDDSSRETALLVVPIRAANSSRVSPEFVLAVMSDESAEYSSSKASHASENPERDAFARSVSLVTFSSIGLYRSTMVLFFLHAVLQNLSRLEPAPNNPVKDINPYKENVCIRLRPRILSCVDLLSDS